MMGKGNKKRKRKRGGEEKKKNPVASNLIFLVRERVFLLSRIVGDPTVGFLRTKKQSCSTRRELRVGTGFRSF